MNDPGNRQNFLNGRLLVAVTLAGWLMAACQVTPMQDSEPAFEDQPVPEFIPVYSDVAYRSLVQKYAMDDGEKVDYAAWQANTEDRATLDEFIALLARVSPENQPGQFPARADQRSYWINAYNALVLAAVLELWPLDSVRDVKVSLSSRVVPGKGFFYDRKVVVGGRETNLYQLEKEVLKSQKDPRLHFALNCASESCPVLRPWEWTDEQLDQAAGEFVSKPENVQVESGVVYLSRIFKWYRGDFPADIGNYLADFAPPGLAERLRTAATENYPVKYREYDWTLNDGAAQ